MPMDYRLVLWVSLLVSVNKHASGLLGPLAVLLPKKSFSTGTEGRHKRTRSRRCQAGNETYRWRVTASVPLLAFKGPNGMCMPFRLSLLKMAWQAKSSAWKAAGASPTCPSVCGNTHRLSTQKELRALEWHMTSRSHRHGETHPSDNATMACSMDSEEKPKEATVWKRYNGVLGDNCNGVKVHFSPTVAW